MQTYPKTIRNTVVSALAITFAIGAASAASAQSYRAPTGSGLGSIVSCDARGGKQAGGALIGALLGAAAGSNLAKNDRGTGTAIGAVVGAATGSYVGCKMQREAANPEGQANGPTYQEPATYSHTGYRLSSEVAPGSFVQEGGAFVARTTLNLRGAPTVSSRKVGQLQAGQRFQALARVRGTDWVLVGQGGVGIGYVSGRYIQPTGYQYAAYSY